MIVCVQTLSAWKLGKKPNGKDLIVFSPPSSGRGEFLMLPCGQCIECRLERSRQWAMRCMHEASLKDDNCFITLTFNDENLDPALSLQKRDFQLFMKRLRKEVVPDCPITQDEAFDDPDLKKFRKDWYDEFGIRYFHAGEYGEEFGRPHHHAILFGFDFPDKQPKATRRGFTYYESDLLSKLWSDPKTGESYGFHEITSVSFETCAYVARYVCKKINGSAAADHYSVMDEQGNVYKREPEYCTMSRRPGIGLKWYEKYGETDAFAHDAITVRGSVKCKPPRYYGSKYELTNPVEYGLIKEKRLKRAKENPDNRFERQRVREVVKTAQYQFLKRSLQ